MVNQKKKKFLFLYMHLVLDTILQIAHYTYQGVTGYSFLIMIYFCPWGMFYYGKHFAAFHRGIHCLPKYLGLQYTNC